MKHYLICASMIVLASCQTAPEPEPVAENEVMVVTGSRIAQPVVPAPPPQGVQGWDGQTYSSLSSVPPAPSIAFEQEVVKVGNGQTVEVIRNETTGEIESYVLRNPEGRVIREFESQDAFEKFTNNPYRSVADAPVSTFSSDVDTASYAVARGYLNRGTLPPKEAIRVEEMLNYFDYGYDAPKSAREPFKTNVAILPSPWNAQTQLLHIGVQGYTPPKRKRAPLNLVFLIDTSGSMDNPEKLGLLKESFTLLVEELTDEDRVSIVAYGPRMETVLVPTSGDRKDAILAAIAPLEADGGTNGEAGLQQAYRVAEQSFIEGGSNRVILATDGDFNIGIQDPQALEDYIVEKRETGVYLSVLGFGQGNLKDNRMQALSQNGNGTAYYIDSLREAKKVFGTDFGQTLRPIADDLKLQVEFNPARVSEYRLLGYETRALAREDFNNDKVDAGDIGAGHSVTAIYEYLPTGASGGFVDPLRYGTREPQVGSSAFSDEIAFVKMRYKRPGEDSSRLLSRSVTTADVSKSLRRAPKAARFATAVAGYGLVLREDDYINSLDMATLHDMAKDTRMRDRYGYKAEFMKLMETVETLQSEE